MRAFLRCCLSILLISSLLSRADAQSLVTSTMNVTGGSYESADSYYRFEWSFGELSMINTVAPDSWHIFTHGVLQPCIDGLAPVPSTKFSSNEYRLFPNPTMGKFEVSFFIRQSGTMSLGLVDANGKLIDERRFPYMGCCSIQHFDISTQPDGVYYLVVDLRLGIYNRSNFGMQRHSGIKIIKLTH
jgi:hypothetical protein